MARYASHTDDASLFQRPDFMTKFPRRLATDPDSRAADVRLVRSKGTVIAELPDAHRIVPLDPAELTLHGTSAPPVPYDPPRQPTDPAPRPPAPHCNTPYCTPASPFHSPTPANVRFANRQATHGVDVDNSRLTAHSGSGLVGVRTHEYMASHGKRLVRRETCPHTGRVIDYYVDRPREATYSRAPHIDLTQTNPGLVSRLGYDPNQPRPQRRDRHRDRPLPDTKGSVLSFDAMVADRTRLEVMERENRTLRLNQDGTRAPAMRDRGHAFGFDGENNMLRIAPQLVTPMRADMQAMPPAAQYTGFENPMAELHRLPGNRTQTRRVGSFHLTDPGLWSKVQVPVDIACSAAQPTVHDSIPNHRGNTDVSQYMAHASAEYAGLDNRAQISDRLTPQRADQRKEGYGSMPEASSFAGTSDHAYVHDHLLPRRADQMRDSRPGHAEFAGDPHKPLMHDHVAPRRDATALVGVRAQPHAEYVGTAAPQVIDRVTPMRADQPGVVVMPHAEHVGQALPHVHDSIAQHRGQDRVDGHMRNAVHLEASVWRPVHHDILPPTRDGLEARAPHQEAQHVGKALDPLPSDALPQNRDGQTRENFMPTPAANVSVARDMSHVRDATLPKRDGMNPSAYQAHPHASEVGSMTDVRRAPNDRVGPARDEYANRIVLRHHAGPYDGMGKSFTERALRTYEAGPDRSMRRDMSVVPSWTMPS